MLHPARIREKLTELFLLIEQISPFSLNKIQRLLVVPASNAITYFAMPVSPFNSAAKCSPVLLNFYHLTAP